MAKRGAQLRFFPEFALRWFCIVTALTKAMLLEDNSEPSNIESASSYLEDNAEAKNELRRAHHSGAGWPNHDSSEQQSGAGSSNEDNSKLPHFNAGGVARAHQLGPGSPKEDNSELPNLNAGGDAPAHQPGPGSPNEGNSEPPHHNVGGDPNAVEPPLPGDDFVCEQGWVKSSPSCGCFPTCQVYNCSEGWTPKKKKNDE